MRSIRVAVLTIMVILAAVTSPAAALPRVPVGDIVGNPTRYIDVRVKLVGEVTKVDPDPLSTGVMYTLQDSSNQAIRVKATAPPELNSRIYTVGTVVQDDGASKPYLIELKHGDPGIPLAILLAAGGVLLVIALALLYFIYVPRPVRAKKIVSVDETEAVKRPIITQVFRDNPVAVLIATSGPHKGETFNIYKGANTIGRDDNQTVQLTDDSTVSRSHARIDAADSSLVIANQSATNPTLIAGEEISERELTDGDIIQIGSTRLKVTVVSAE